MDLNTCFETTRDYHAIAYASHLIPIFLSLFLSIYSLIKTKYSKLSITFFAFTFSFSLWLLGDLITWTSSDYFSVYINWSWLDYVNIIFFVMGSYFFTLLTTTRVPNIEKMIYILICLPAFIITISGNSVINFYQPACEAINNNFLTNYKFWAQWIIVTMMIVRGLRSWNKIDRQSKLRLFTVFSGMILFFAVFGYTEYIASVTGVYEINLYGLFILPVFLIVIVFSMTNLGLFHFRLLGTQILAYVLIILTGSQLIFIQGSTYRNLTLLTLAAAILIGYLLLSNANKEIEQRQKIEKLAKDLGTANQKLKELDQMKSEFLSLATHQIRSPLTAIKGYSSMLLENDFGELPITTREPVKTIMISCQHLIDIVNDFLDISRIEQGRMVYNKEKFDLLETTKEVISQIRPNIEKAGLELKMKLPENQKLFVNGDKNKISQVVANLIDNAIKYTPKGFIEVSALLDHDIVEVSVKDSGIGIATGEVHKLFSKFSRTKDAHKTNVTGTGLGLYIAKKMAEAHNGDIKVSSEGEGRGTKFTLELPIFKG